MAKYDQKRLLSQQIILMSKAVRKDSTTNKMDAEAQNGGEVGGDHKMTTLEMVAGMEGLLPNAKQQFLGWSQEEQDKYYPSWIHMSNTVVALNEGDTFEYMLKCLKNCNNKKYRMFLKFDPKKQDRIFGKWLKIRNDKKRHILLNQFKWKGKDIFDLQTKIQKPRISHKKKGPNHNGYDLPIMLRENGTHWNRLLMESSYARKVHDAAKTLSSLQPPLTAAPALVHNPNDKWGETSSGQPEITTIDGFEIASSDSKLDKISSDKQRGPGPKKRFFCTEPFCAHEKATKFGYANKEDLTKHELIQHTEGGKSRHHCPLCDSKFDHKRSLNKHLNKKHNGVGVKNINKFQCLKCNTNFRTKKEYDEHVQGKVSHREIRL